MLGSVELLILLVFALIYLAMPFVTLIMVIKVNQRLADLDDLIKSRM